MRVLIVEDNVDAAEMLGALLASLGHEFRIAHHPDDALALLDEWSAEVVLSDIGLPDVDGLDFARLVRARRASRTNMFLVALSGYGDAKYRSLAREAGFDAHLTK